ncbi:hypothetical protein KXD40_005716 [Peronospora effusa]|nr:hypothetical protein KXD40_005716 [Peronospora effusa]
MASLDKNRNRGCLLDEQNRRDRIFLSKEYLRRKGATATHLRYLLADYRGSEPTQTRVDFGSLFIHLKILTRLFECKILYSHLTWPLVLLNNLLVIFLIFCRAKLKPKIPLVDTPTGLSKEPNVTKATHRAYLGISIYHILGIFHTTPLYFSRPNSSSFTTAVVNELESEGHQAWLSSSHSAMLDVPLTANDFNCPIKHTASGNSPGLDGLPADVYQLFSNHRTLVLKIVFAPNFLKGPMMVFQRHAYFLLLLKLGSRSDPKNHRSLALLNQDSNLGPKALRCRLNKVLPSLLGVDQPFLSCLHHYVCRTRRPKT